MNPHFARASRVFNLYSDYSNVVEKVRIATIAEIRDKEYSLAISNYIEKKQFETIPPDEVRRQYFEAFEEMVAAEEKLRNLLIEGGYVNE